MKKWRGLIAIAVALALLAIIAWRWSPLLLGFLGANSDVIQSLEAGIQILLWGGALAAFILGWRWRSRSETSSTAGSTIISAQAEGGAVVAQGQSTAAGSYGAAVGGNVNGDVIVVADSDQLWRNIRKRPPAEELRRATEAYLRHLVDTYQFLDFKGMGVSDRVALRLPLAEMYVPLKARIELPEGETWVRQLQLAGRKLTAEETEAIGSRLSQPTPVIDLLKKHDGLIILGDPGAGKTTFLKYLTLMLAQGKGETLGLAAKLPVLAPLSAYANALAQHDVPLDRFIVDYYNSRGIDLPLGAMLDEALAQGGALLLLDGLDEVRNQGLRRTVVDRAMDFFTMQRRRGNKFILTSRIVGYKEVRPAVAGMGECTLVDFDQEEIEQFVTAWTAAIERAARGDTPVAGQEARRERAELLEAVRRNPGVRQLAANPLLLTILALMKRQGVTLPERRVELYQKYVETLLKHWNLARGLGRPPSRELDVVETMRVLAPLALWMHRTSPGVGLVKQEEMRRELERICAERALPEPAAAARRFLEDVREYAGLLLERGPREYGFIHLTFQEYLAAVAIAQQGQEEAAPIVALLAGHVAEETWHEVSLLTVAYLGIIQQRDAAASKVVQGLIETAPGEPGQAAALAGEAVLDAWPGGVTPACRAGVIAALMQTMRDAGRVRPVQRAAAGRVLAKLGDPGMEVLDPVRIEWIEIPAGPFLMGEGKEQHTVTLPAYRISRFPITNAQFTAFVQAGGYGEDRYWPEAKAAKVWRDGRIHSRYEKEPTSGPWPLGEPFNLSNHPAVGVCWYEALAYTRWLSERWQAAGQLQPGWFIRLAGEAEWEKAARGADGRAYPWGQEADPNRANYDATGIGTTSAVGCFPGGASPYQVEEMSGNVWEWCLSKYADYPYADDRRNLADGSGDAPVVRGGSFDNFQRLVRCPVRNFNGPDFRDGSIGFRVVLSSSTSGLWHSYLLGGAPPPDHPSFIDGRPLASTPSPSSSQPSLLAPLPGGTNVATQAIQDACNGLKALIGSSHWT